MNAFDALPFRPKLWEQSAIALVYGTCWTYAVGDRQLIMLQSMVEQNPGALSGNKLVDCRPERLIEHCIKDGLEHTGKQVQPRPGTYPIALFYSEELDDYHAARKNPPGQGWSQKYMSLEPEIFKNKRGKAIETMPQDFRYSIRLAEGVINYSLIATFNVPRTLSWHGKPEELDTLAAARTIVFRSFDVNAENLYRRLGSARSRLKARLAKGNRIVPVG